MELDEVNETILYVLQRDARRVTTREIGEQAGVSASTVRNRIERLEDEGVIRGYYPEIDYDGAGLQLRVLFVCSATGHERGAVIERVRDVSGVVGIRKLVDGTEDVQIEAVGTDTDDVARISDEVSELGLQIANSTVVTSTHQQPFDHFGERFVDETRDDRSD